MILEPLFKHIFNKYCILPCQKACFCSNTPVQVTCNYCRYATGFPMLPASEDHTNAIKYQRLSSDTLYNITIPFSTLKSPTSPLVLCRSLLSYARLAYYSLQRLRSPVFSLIGKQKVHSSQLLSYVYMYIYVYCMYMRYTMSRTCAMCQRMRKGEVV